MGRGSVHKAGRIVRFVAGGTNPPESSPTSECTTNPPSSPSDTKAATVATVDETFDTQGLELSPQDLVSPVTQQSLLQVDMPESQIDVQNFPIELDTLVSMENISGSDCISNELEASPSEEILKEIEPVDCDSNNQRGDDETSLPRQAEIQSWLVRIATVQNADDCMDCLEALHQLPQAATEYIWSSAEALLPRFWSVAEIEVTDQAHQESGVGFGTKVSTQQQTEQQCEGFSIITPSAESHQNSGIGEGTEVSPQQPHQPGEGDLNTMAAGAEKPELCASAKVRDLITGLWVRCRDGRDWFYGYLGAMTGDGRWWVSSPKTRNSNAESRLYAAADIIPMPAS
jgi:hypothetical protein